MIAHFNLQNNDIQGVKNKIDAKLHFFSSKVTFSRVNVSPLSSLFQNICFDSVDDAMNMTLGQSENITHHRSAPQHSSSMAKIPQPKICCYLSISISNFTDKSQNFSSSWNVAIIPAEIAVLTLDLCSWIIPCRGRFLKKRVSVLLSCKNSIVSL